MPSGIESLRRTFAGAIAGVAMLLVPLAATAVTVQSDNFSDRWVAPNERLVIRFDALPAPNAGRIAVFVGSLDMTALFRATGPGELSVTPSLLQLPSGERDLVVYQVVGTRWNELARRPLRVLTPGGFESGTITPRLDVNVKSQVSEGHSGDAVTPPRQIYQDLAGQGGWQTEHRRGDFAITSGFNFVGSSVREEALRFGELGNDAPKTDLSDYQVGVTWGSTQFALGHVSYGNNPLLLNSMASRGITLRRRFGGRFDLSLNEMNGTSIVGTDNFFGLNDAQHRIRGATAGFELIGGRPGALRMELSYLDASVKSIVNFNAGEIPDAEESQGSGLRLLGNTADGRLRGDLVLARSRYVNPNDPVLAQGSALVAVTPTTDSGRMVDLAYDLVRGSKVFSERQPLTVTVSLHQEHIDPLYKSLGAFLGADQDLNRVGIGSQIGAVQVQLQGSRKEDNVDDVPTVLKTRTDDRSFSVGLPLATLLATDGAPARRWPNLNFTHQTNHQFAINAPAFAASGFQPTHLPDQFNTADQLNASWGFERWALSYGYSRSSQDNRQTGRETADFENRGHQLSFNVQWSDSVNINLGFARTRNHSVEQNLTTRNTNASFGFDWRLGRHWSLNGAYGSTSTDDSQNLASSEGYTSQTQIAYRFDVPGPGGRKLPGQFFLRHALQDNQNRDNTFGLATRGQNWSVNAGLSLSFF